jgi:hypothetical protein
VLCCDRNCVLIGAESRHFLLRDFVVIHYENGNSKRKTVLLIGGDVSVGVQCVALDVLRCVLVTSNGAGRGCYWEAQPTSHSTGTGFLPRNRRQTRDASRTYVKNEWRNSSTPFCNLTACQKLPKLLAIQTSQYNTKTHTRW